VLVTHGRRKVKPSVIADETQRGYEHGEMTNNPVLLQLAIVALLGVVAGRAAEKLRVPDVVIFLLAGLVASLAGWHPFSSGSPVGQAITVTALSYVLYRGGQGLEIAVLKEIWLSVVLLATVGVVVTMLVIAGFAVVILQVSLPIGLLVGAVLSATDPSVLVPIYDELAIRPRIAHLVISEAAFNDATGAICATVVASFVISGTTDGTSILLAFIQLLVVGLAVGIVTGSLTALTLADRPSILQRYAGAVELPVAIVIYLIAGALGGSGLMAAFIAGLTVANLQRRPRLSMSREASSNEREYSRGTSMIVRGLLFITLGASLDLDSVAELTVPALGLVVVLIAIARPLAVVVCAMPDRIAGWEWRELVILAWTRETGVVPGALAAFLLSTHVPGATYVAVVTAACIIVTVSVQGSTTGWLARRLDLIEMRPNAIDQ